MKDRFGRPWRVVKLRTVGDLAAVKGAHGGVILSHLDVPTARLIVSSVNERCEEHETWKVLLKYLKNRKKDEVELAKYRARDAIKKELLEFVRTRFNATSNELERDEIRAFGAKVEALT